MWYDLHNHIKKLVLESQGNPIMSFLMWVGVAVMCTGAHHLLQRLDVVPRRVWVDVSIYALAFVFFVVGFLRRRK